MSQHTTLVSAFRATVADRGHEEALRNLDGSISLTWQEYDARVRRIAAGLHALGVRHGSTVGIMLTNRPEFNCIDAAAFHLGAVPFSIYNTSSADQIAHLFNNAENTIVFCEPSSVQRVTEAAHSTAVDHIVCLDEGPAATMSLDEVEAAGEAGFDFEGAAAQVEPSDVLTLIYTSGTTGPPKGVQLTHANVLASITSLDTVASTEGEDCTVSYLPDAHIVNRYVAHYLPITHGVSVVTVADPKTLLEALTQVRPTLFVAVPMLWYKIKGTLESSLAEESDGPKKALAQWAIGIGRKVAALECRGKAVPLTLRLQHAVAGRLVLRTILRRLGLDRVKLALSGAAPIAEEAMTFMLGLGIPICEAWGMSELSTAATINRPGSVRIGTVGTALPGAEVTVADDGELLVRGPIVMKGYRNDPEKTADAVDQDGWMHTGDIGTIDADGYVRIMDRKKELIINTGGKNMSPSNIENHIKVAAPLVGSAVAIGDARKYVVALITLDPDAAAAFAETHGVEGDAATLADHDAVRDVVRSGVDAANAQLSRVEQVKDFVILPTFWEPGGDELTPTMKLRRKAIDAKYADEIQALYSSGQPTRQGA